MKAFVQWLKSVFAWLRRKLGLKRARAPKLTGARYALVLGIERSAKFGACPGAKRDSLQMKKLLEGIAALEYLSDANATKAHVVQMMKDLISKVPPDGMFILTYSGHGGSQKFVDTKNETDGQDEYLCLYDGYLKDDDIWDMVTKCRGKVFLFFDCCHSETMFRTPLVPPEDLVKEDDLAGMGTRDAKIPDSPVDMLVWSGCPDNTYSYGDSSGGLFTNALLSALNVGNRTYKDIWAYIKADNSLSRYAQKPQQTVLGNFSTDAELWS